MLKKGQHRRWRRQRMRAITFYMDPKKNASRQKGQRIAATSQPSNIHGSTASVSGSNIQHLEFCKRDHKNQIFSFGRFSQAIGVRFYILGRNKHPKFHKTACSVLCPKGYLYSMIGHLLCKMNRFVISIVSAA